jgi:hypothetical protein
MRTIIAILLASLVLVTPLALADGGPGRSDAGKARAAEERATHASHDDADPAARHAAREEAAANRTALFERFMTRLEAIRASWTENATKIREDCRGDFDHEDATKDERLARAHCIRDGYADWRAEHRADLRELREELRALFSARGRGHVEH